MDQPRTGITVASVPAGHPYVRGIGAPGDGVTRLPDPLPDPADPGRWWPPVVLDAVWLRTNAEAFDLLHVHFGTESLPPGRLEEALDELRRLGRPLVYTAHDLSNPQLTDQTRHEADLALLLGRADAVITLTPGAAAEIARRWGVSATVVPHPAVVEVDATTPVGALVGPVTIGVHLRDLRPGIDAVGAVATLVAGLDELRAGGVAAAGRVVVNDRVRDPDALTELSRLVAHRPDCSLVTRPRVDDAELEREVADLDVALLPYRHGTHSGWVELCHDLGVPVVGPRVGHAHEQHPGQILLAPLGDAVAFAAAVRSAAAAGTRPGSVERRVLVQRRAQQRRAERPAIARAHAQVYRGVLERTGVLA